MGVSSPFLTAEASPLGRSRCAAKSPEIALLEVVKELTEEFLPEAACAVRSCQGQENVHEAAIERKRGGILPSSYYRGLVCKNTFLTLIEDLDTEDESSESDVSPPKSGSRARACSECTGLNRLKSSGISEMDFMLDSGSEAANADSNDSGEEAGESEHPGEYLPMWCRMQRRDEETSIVLPCMDEASLAAAHDAGEALYLWCWAQPDGLGGTIVTPLTDREEPPCATKPPTAAEAACAPPPAPADGFRPPWVSGPCWPFNALPTTLVLSGLPQGLTQDGLLEVLDRYSLSGFYDFVYLAADPSTELTCGEAVVNLTRHEYALVLAAKLQGRTHWGTDDAEETLCPCQVRWSLPLQGLDDLVREHREHPWNAEDVPDYLRPQLFKDGWPAPLSAAYASSAAVGEGCYAEETTYFGFAGW